MSNVQVSIHQRWPVIDLLPRIAGQSRFGFSGSRRRFSDGEKRKVVEIIDILPPSSTVISGHCSSRNTAITTDPITGKTSSVTILDENTDRWSVARARERGLAVIEHPPSYPDLPSIKQRIAAKTEDHRAAYWYITAQNYARDKAIVDDCTILFALPPVEAETRDGKIVKKGGTWHTIRVAIAEGKIIYVNLEGEEGWILVSKDMIKVSTGEW